MVQLIRGLRENVTDFVIVINGECKDTDLLRQYAGIIIERENKGFDGGAFKVALAMPGVQELVARSDELVLCNDTFYGSFVPFSDIFAKMRGSEADFWGIRFADNGLTQLLQSFFLVFRKRILSSCILTDFFALYPENSTNFNDALVFFERNIFCYLTEKGYTHDAFYKLRYRALDADII